MSIFRFCTLVLVSALLVAVSTYSMAATLQVPQDHKSIQAAIDAAKAGDTVVVSPGTYKERIRLKPGITVKSAGDNAKGELGIKRAEATILDGGGQKAKGPGIVMAEGATLDGFTVTNVGAYDEAVWNRHHATHGAELADNQGAVGTGTGFPAVGCPGVNCTLRHNIVHHNGHAGIGIRGAKGKKVSPHVYRNVVYRNMGGGIGSSDGSTATIEENIGFQNLRAAIGSRNASPLIINNVCYENVRAGIGQREGAKPILRGNKCYRNRRAGIGIRMEGTSPIIENNECYENEMAGIGNRDGATPIIRNNRCYRNKMAGIGSRSGARALIENNECYENDMAGIGSRLGAAPLIRNNRCYRNKMAGIGSREKARPVIEGNECFENNMAGIGAREGAAPIIRNNRCYNNAMAGIGSRLGARAVIVENECYGNLMAGIGTREGAAPVILRNRCYKNKMAGIGSRDGARPLIVENESRENEMAGIGVRTETRALIIGNKCLENRLVAIGLPDGATAYIHGNELIRTSAIAPPMVALRGGAHAVVSDNLIRGGGVAGVLLQGTARISGNQFEGRGPDKQGSAIWVPFGGSFKFKSTVVASNNRCSGYRDLINAANCNAAVHDNSVSNFRRVAINVGKPTAPPRVFGNVAYSDEPGDKAVSVQGSTGQTLDNELRSPGDAEKPKPFDRLWPILKDTAPEQLSKQFQKVFGPEKVTDGPWTLVVTRGKKTTYKLFNSEIDPDEKTDLSKRVPHLAFRLKGLRERQEAESFKEYMVRHGLGR